MGGYVNGAATANAQTPRWPDPPLTPPRVSGCCNELSSDVDTVTTRWQADAMVRLTRGRYPFMAPSLFLSGFCGATAGFLSRVIPAEITNYAEATHYATQWCERNFIHISSLAPAISNCVNSLANGEGRFPEAVGIICAQTQKCDALHLPASKFGNLGEAALLGVVVGCTGYIVVWALMRHRALANVRSQPPPEAEQRLDGEWKAALQARHFEQVRKMSKLALKPLPVLPGDLLCAVTANDAPTLTALLRAAGVNASKLIGTQSKRSGESTFLFAARHGKFAMFALLLEAGGDLRARSVVDGKRVRELVQEHPRLLCHLEQWEDKRLKIV